ncbi:MAG: flavodoxin-dependent (E)-4-hydroxy-3-methylbut-2-enyl-diphosphate synthase [Lachnospiraceae bacterium]|nr:flavodoxin-dependent (E)-4-hydroxy-3-methylbut-2-enyl-diphosphate synthase [Lachnospiraceae bacterium]
MRLETKQVRIGDVCIGGGAPIAIQSMCNTKTEDVEATVRQIRALEELGCEIIRVAVPTQEAADAIREIKKQIHIPLVADIHFDYRLAIASIRSGADKIRINPGNIGDRDRVLAVVNEAKAAGIPIRVGVNSGSLEKPLIEKYGGVTAQGLTESALSKVRMLEEMDFSDIVISIKASDVPLCVESYERVSKETNYPLHVGVTEAGSVWAGNIKSAVGIGILLHEGIGDTIRVSLTGSPEEEVRSAIRILKTLGLRQGGIELVSCPTCGRTKIDLIGLAARAEELVGRYDDLPIRVAVMGCVVNGPGEAREADLGIAGGDGEGLLFRKGEILAKMPESELLPALERELERLRAERNAKN